MVRALAVALMLIAAPALAQTEREYQERLCVGMELEYVLPDGARIDCLGEMHAWEVDFTDRWADALGQALYYGAATGKRPGIIFVCRRRFETCLGHLHRVNTVIARWNLPVTVWVYEERGALRRNRP